jgi:KDO2-lipid IV(A) lauroyltransferase
VGGADRESWEPKVDGSTMTLKDTLEYVAALCALKALRLLPLHVALGVGELLGQLMFSVVRIRRKVTMRNLAAAFPTVEPIARRRIASECYRQMGISAAEFARMDSWVRRGVHFANLSLARRLLEAGKGLVIVTGHFGNWEALAAASALRMPLAAVGRPQRNRKVSDLINSRRRAHGFEVFPATIAGLKGAREALGRGRAVVFLVDQDAGRRGVFVDFLGRPASATPIPMALARRAGAPLVPCYISRRGKANHVVEFEEPIPPDSSISAVQLVADSLARRIRVHPEQYFWAHRRWKTQPKSVPGSAQRQIPGA